MLKMLKLKPLVGRVSWALSLVSFAGFVVIAVLSVVDVILQRVFNSPVLGVYEIVERCMMCAVFCAFAYGQTQKTHINMTLILAKLPRVPQMAIFAVMQLLSVGMSVILTYASAVQIGSAFEAATVTGMLHIPLWPFYIVECIAMAVFTVTLVYDLALAVGGIFSDKLAEEVRADWT